MLALILGALYWLLLLGYSSMFVIQQVTFSSDWTLACDYSLKIWCTVWLVRHIVTIILALVKFHLNVNRVSLSGKNETTLFIVRGLVDVFGFAWWLYGIKAVLVDGDESCNKTTLRWGLGCWYYQLSLITLPCVLICLVLPCCYCYLSGQVPPSEAKPTPSAYLEMLETQTWKDYREAKVQGAAPSASRLPTSRPSPSAAKELVKAVAREISAQSIGIPVSKDTDFEETCAICHAEYEDLDEIIILPCPGQHFFHKDCVFTWLEKSQLCPMCRGNVVDLLTEKTNAEATKEQNQGDGAV